jgi:hypothetical protein
MMVFEGTSPKWRKFYTSSVHFVTRLLDFGKVPIFIIGMKKYVSISKNDTRLIVAVDHPPSYLSTVNKKLQLVYQKL